MTLSNETFTASPVNTGARAVEEQVELFKDYPDLIPVVPDMRDITGQSAQTLRALINKGDLPGCRIGRRLYVSKTQFVEYIMEGGGLK